MAVKGSNPAQSLAVTGCPSDQVIDSLADLGLLPTDEIVKLPEPELQVTRNGVAVNFPVLVAPFSVLQCLVMALNPEVLNGPDVEVALPLRKAPNVVDVTTPGAPQSKVNVNGGGGGGVVVDTVTDALLVGPLTVVGVKAAGNPAKGPFFGVTIAV